MSSRLFFFHRWKSCSYVLGVLVKLVNPKLQYLSSRIAGFIILHAFMYVSVQMLIQLRSFDIMQQFILRF